MQTQATSRLIGPVYDIQITKTKSGRDFLTLTLKSWRPSRSGEDKVCWWKVVAYEGSARVLHKYLYNGRVVVIDGHMDLYRDGDLEKFQIILEKFYFLGFEEGK